MYYNAHAIAVNFRLKNHNTCFIRHKKKVGAQYFNFAGIINTDQLGFKSI